jgi:GPI mannosyltransferase 3
VFVAVGDYCLFGFSKREFGASAAQWTLLTSLLSWFMFDVIVRTYSNSLETVLVEMFLFFWPMTRTSGSTSRRIALLFAAIAVIVRPTSVLLWAWFGVLHLVESSNKFNYLLEVAAIGSAMTSISALADRWFFGRWVFPPLEFFKFNVLHGGSSIYGTHPWHWFFSNAFPTILATLLVPLGFCIWRCIRHPAYRPVVMSIFAPILLFVLILSANPHKEFRFLLPILPLCLVACGIAFRDIEEATRRSARRKTFFYVLVAIFLPQIIMGTYFSVVHQRGTIDVMHFIRDAAQPNSSVSFLMPCHSTPYHAYVHRGDLNMSFLDCSPNLESPKTPDEADLFYENPTAYLDTSPHLRSNSTYLIMFDGLASKLRSWLQENKFSQVADFFHAHIHEGRVGGSVLVFYK